MTDGQIFTLMFVIIIALIMPLGGCASCTETPDDCKELDEQIDKTHRHFTENIGVIA